MQLVQQVATAGAKEQISRCIDAAQLGCINLLDTLATYIADIRSAPVITEIHQHIIQSYIQAQNSIEQLMSFIQSNFGIYASSFNYNFCSIHPLTLNQLRLRYLTLKHKLQSLCADTNLYNLMTKPADDFFNATTLNTYNYSGFMYFKEYISRLEKILSLRKSSEIITPRIMECLLLVNYNKYAFINYIFNSLRQEVDKTFSPLEKISAIKLLLRRCIIMPTAILIVIK